MAATAAAFFTAFTLFTFFVPLYDLGYSAISIMSKYQSGVLVLVLLRQVQEPVLFVEGNGREIGINGDETEGQGIALALQLSYEHIHHIASNVLTTKLQ